MRLCKINDSSKAKSAAPVLRESVIQKLKNCAFFKH